MVCFVRQALDASRLFTDDEKIHERVMRKVLKAGSEIDLTQSPPLMGEFLHQTIKEELNCDDPYRRVKDDFTKFALKLEDKLREKVQASDDKLEAALKISIAGNIIDFGVKSTLEEKDVMDAIEHALTEPFEKSTVAQFRQDSQNASEILFLADNAGEIVFDKLLIEQLPKEKITVAVKSGPIINDATIEDAKASGLTDIVRVIGNGTSIPGTEISRCSSQFLEIFNRAGMIIAKGQGNYETLSSSEKPIWFLLKAKCKVIATHLNLPVGSVVLRKHSQPE